jgi:hypothetical protein
LNSTPEILSSIGCTGTGLSFQKKNGEDSSQMSMQELELHIREQSSDQDNFQRTIDALHD